MDWSSENYKNKSKILFDFYNINLCSCTLQPMIFPQAGNNRFDIIDNKVCEEKRNMYLSQFSRLVDSIVLLSIKDHNGIESSLTFGQEFYIRFTLASLLISHFNSYDKLGQEIRESMDLGYTSILFIAKIEMNEEKNRWFVQIDVDMHKNENKSITHIIRNYLNIDSELFMSEKSFYIYTTFDDTPKKLLTEFHDLLNSLMLTTSPLINPKYFPERSYCYADFWLKKHLATIILESEEWNTIKSIDNIRYITNIRYYLWNEDPCTKTIQFRCDIHLKNKKVLNIDYEVHFPLATIFGMEYVQKVCEFVLNYNSLEYVYDENINKNNYNNKSTNNKNKYKYEEPYSVNNNDNVVKNTNAIINIFAKFLFFSLAIFFIIFIINAF